MFEILSLLIDFIRLDMFVAFAWYAIVFYLVKVFSKRKETLLAFDDSATQLMIYSGLVFGFLWIIRMIVGYVAMNETEQHQFTQRLTGPYGVGIWLQSLFWVGLSQLLRVKRLRKAVLFRFIVGISFVITFERLVIFITSLHRDYLPPHSGMSPGYFNFNIFYFIMSILLKVAWFMVITGLYYFSKNYLKNRNLT